MAVAMTLQGSLADHRVEDVQQGACACLVRDGPSPSGVVCPVWLTAITITTNNVTMPAMTTTRTIHAPTPNSDGYGGGWAIASSYRRLHTRQVASLGLNPGMSR
jgi:hypothetical protein